MPASFGSSTITPEALSPGSAQETRELLRGEPQRDAEPSRSGVILAIDDEISLCHMLGFMLRVDGYEVVSCASGEEGLALFREREFDAVFTDLGMPGMSGWEVARAIKALAPDVPVVLVTGWGVELEQESLAENGVDLLVCKPFRTSDVRRVVAEAMRLRRQAQARS
ncbi:MAG: response regulator [Chloroflexota bacterium]